MSRPHSRRSPQMVPLLLRFILILLFAAVAIYAGYHCLFRAPQQLDQPVQNTEELSPEEVALQSHLEGDGMKHVGFGSKLHSPTQHLLAFAVCLGHLPSSLINLIHE